MSWCALELVGRKDSPIPRWSGFLSWLLLGILVITWSASASAQGDDDEAVGLEEPPAEVEPAPRSGSQFRTKSATEDGPGIMGNVGFLGLKTLGREDSIAPAEIFPYMLIDEHFVFSDVRGFVSTQGYFGGNLGFGYRRLVPNQHAWYGVNAWYDIDDTSSQLFHQLGFGLEAAFRSFEARSNFYFPIGDTDQTLINEAQNIRFVGNGIRIDQHIVNGQALPGVDAEVGYVLPVKALGESSVVRAFVGGYWFVADGDGDNINGVQARVEAELASSVIAQVQFTNDDEYGSNVMVGMQVNFPFGESNPGSNWRRNTPSPFRYVHRNYNIILDQRDDSLTNVAAINPRTGNEYVVAHVDTTSGTGGNGYVDNPFKTYASAKASGADLIYVHSGSVLNEQIVVGDNVRLLGEGGNHWIALSNGQSARLPSLHSTVDTPRITGITGNSITLGSGSEIAGFTIDHITGNGIVGDGVSNVSLHDLAFSNISGDAVRLLNTSGNVTLQNLTATDIGGRGLMFDGGTADLVMANNSFSRLGDDGVTIQNMTGGSVNVASLSISDVSGRGLVLANVATDLVTTATSISETDETAIDISGGSGTYTFKGLTDLEDVAGGFRVHDTDIDLVVHGTSITRSTPSTTPVIDYLNATPGTFGDTLTPGVSVFNTTGDIHFGTLLVENTNLVGVFVRDADSFRIDDGKITTVNGVAFDAKDSNLDVNLDAINVDGGPYGIRLVRATGGFTVNGTDTSTVGGTIQNVTTAVLLNDAGTVTLAGMTFQDGTRGIVSRSTELLSVTNANFSGMSGYAIDSTNDDLLSVANSTFSNNGAIGAGTIRVAADANDLFRSQFTGNTITDANGTAIQFLTLAGGDGALMTSTIANNTFNLSRGGESGIEMQWKGPASLSIASNVFNLSGSGMTGINLVGLSTTDTLDAEISNNTMTFTGTTGTGVNMTAAEDSNLKIGGNKVTFNASGGTGLKFDLTGVTTTWIYSNIIVDNGAAATGMLFKNVGDNSRVQFDDNVIDLNSSSASVDRGIIFEDITGDLTFYGTYNNVVEGATDVYYVPLNSSTGKFYLNGVAVP